MDTNIAGVAKSYEAPRLTALGSFYDLTLWGKDNPPPCVFNKTLGPPDFFTFIPIANCSA